MLLSSLVEFWKTSFQWANFKCLNLCTNKISKTFWKSPCYQIDNLANVASLLWFIWNVEDDFFLDLWRVYAFKWFIMYVIQKYIWKGTLTCRCYIVKSTLKIDINNNELLETIWEHMKKIKEGKGRRYYQIDKPSISFTIFLTSFSHFQSEA
jgi:hypothetical protein